MSHANLDTRLAFLLFGAARSTWRPRIRDRRGIRQQVRWRVRGRAARPRVRPRIASSCWAPPPSARAPWCLNSWPPSTCTPTILRSVSRPRHKIQSTADRERDARSFVVDERAVKTDWMNRNANRRSVLLFIRYKVRCNYFARTDTEKSCVRHGMARARDISGSPNVFQPYVRERYQIRLECRYSFTSDLIQRFICTKTLCKKMNKVNEWNKYFF